MHSISQKYDNDILIREVERSQEFLNKLPEGGVLATITKAIPKTWYENFIGTQIVVVPHDRMSSMVVMYPGDFLVYKFDLVWNTKVKVSDSNIPPAEELSKAYLQNDGFYYRAVVTLHFEYENIYLGAIEKYCNNEWVSVFTDVETYADALHILKDPDGVADSRKRALKYVYFSIGIVGSLIAIVLMYYLMYA